MGASNDPDRLIGNISDILSWDWVRETHMDVAAEMFNATCTSDWLASNPYLAFTLCKLPLLSDAQVQAEEALTNVMELVEHNSAQHIVFPVNIDDNHWIVVHIDLNAREHSQGLSSIHPSDGPLQPMLTTINAVQR